MYSGEGKAPVIATAQGADGAVGVSKKWFVAFVGNRAEKKTRERLEQLGHECYVAAQKELHQWANGKKRWVEVVKITGLVFVRVTEKQRREIVELPYILSFLTDKAAKTNEAGGHPVAVIPDSQIQQLRFMLYHSQQPVDFIGSQFTVGDSVQVTRGSLSGMEGNVVSVKGDSNRYIGVQLGCLGCAILRIPAEDLKSIHKA